MNAAELFLRLGCSLVGWLVLYAHLLWLATSRVLVCGSDGDELWRLLLLFAPIAVGFSFLLSMSRRLPSVHDTLRWAAAPLVLLVPLGLLGIWRTFEMVNLTGGGICSEIAAPWHPWWAPLQAVALLVICLLTYRAWRPSQ